jgi:hypothetical protein
VRSNQAIADQHRVHQGRGEHVSTVCPVSKKLVSLTVLQLYLNFTLIVLQYRSFFHCSTHLRVCAEEPFMCGAAERHSMLDLTHAVLQITSKSNTEREREEAKTQILVK